MFLDRLTGLETEYAIRYTPRASEGDDAPRPGNDVIFDALSEALKGRVHTRSGDRRLQRRQMFTENGGSVCYEALPWAMDGGLVEGGTPECRGPGQLMLYQRAQDALLLGAARDASELLAEQGFHGTVGLLKNCRDAEGHVYGAQENYELPIADGAGLWVYRAGLVALLPAVAITVVATWAMLFGVMIAALGLLIVLSTLGVVILPLGRWLSSLGLDDNRGVEKRMGRAFYWLELGMWGPVMTLFSWWLRATAFRRHRDGLLTFFATRSVLTGAGTVMPDGSFQLSEKGPAIVRVMRSTPLSVDRAIFDTGNLLKHLSEPTLLQFSKLAALFRQRQRMQLGLSDSNVAQLAEYLKIGVTSLVVDLADAGYLHDAPRLTHPVKALHTIIADPTLEATVAFDKAQPATALAVQRWYYERAKAVLEQAPAMPMNAREILRLWGEALDGLEKDPNTLVGRLDWVTKRYLLETAGGDAPEAVLKKIDLKYHELGEGYLTKLEAIGEAPVLVDRADVQAAITSPPTGTPAFARGRLVKRLADSGADAVVSWDRVRIGGRFGGEVIRLSDFRKNEDSDD